MIVIIVYTGKIRRISTMKYTNIEAITKAQQYAYEIRHGRHTEPKEHVSFEEWFLNGVRKYEEQGADFDLIETGMVRIKWPRKVPILRTVASFREEYESLFPSVTGIQFEECAGMV
jgi:hypothetical protein